MTTELGPVLAQSYATTRDKSSLDVYFGELLEWNPVVFNNAVRVRGTVVYDLPVLTSAGLIGLNVGDVVQLLRVRTQYFIVGRVVDQNSGLVNPQYSIVMYPQFKAIRASGAPGYWNVANGTLASWEGRIKISFPYVEFDGTWGPDTGGSTTTYSVIVGGVTVGSWTETAVVTARRGPFPIQDFTGNDWEMIEVKITATTGGGNAALQVMGAYFRDSL
jgi:hypothetical protein